MQVKKRFWPVTALVILCLFWLFLTNTAQATTKPPVTPPTPSTPTTDIDVNISPEANAAAAAVAKAKADAAANAASQSNSQGIGLGTGGASDADAAASGGGASLTDNSSSSTRMLVFPAPVWSTVPEARTCIATNSSAHAIGWNFWSRSKTSQASDPACIGVLMARSAYANCHFLSEAMITQRVYRTVFGPEAPELPMAPDLRNLSLAECEELKKPKLVMTPLMAPPVVVSAPAPAPVATVTCPVPEKPAKRSVVQPKRPVLTCPVPLVPAK